MIRLCHRCHAELPGVGQFSGPKSSSDDDHALFCPRCGAPQILLPEYMRTESVAAVSAESTTGAVPPPRPQLVDWPVAAMCAAPVAVATAVFALAGLVVPAASFLNTLCVLTGAGVVLGLYRSRRPLARINGRVGLRVGLLTGLMMIAAMGVALALTGLIERFGLHGLASFDAEVAQQFVTLQGQMVEKMQAQDQGRDAQQKMLGYLTSPEVRAGLALFYVSLLAGFVLVLTTVCGAFTGMLQTKRRAL